MFVAFTRNALSLAGMLVATLAFLVFAAMFGLDLVSAVELGPYTGILTFVIVPTVFIGGLVLIPIGVFLERRRERRAQARGEPPPRMPIVDFNSPRTRAIALTVALLTSVNVLVVFLASYKAVEVMDSTPFCGATCHSVMSPEYTTYQRSPHARVACVNCHIGPGASWFVKSKLSGTWQLVSVALDLYPRPVPTPVENLRPARETCEVCHWPSKFVGERLKVNTSFTDAEQTEEQKTVLVVRVGGVTHKGGQGIHWHVDPGVRIRYQSDAKRQTVGRVELTGADGAVKTFEPKPKEGAPAMTGEWRTMDCVDCHNRPTHIYGVPEREVDHALASGTLDRTLPWIRREGLSLVKAEYASHDDARGRIRAGLEDFYRKNHSELAVSRAADVAKAAEELGRIYTTNVFPQMGIKWGTYPNFLGHQTTDGCFRCHDDEHKTDKGEAIRQDCDLCHALLAQEEKEPEILKQLSP